MEHINYTCDCCGKTLTNEEVNIIDMPRMMLKFPYYEHLVVYKTHLCNNCMAEIADNFNPIYITGV